MKEIKLDTSKVICWRCNIRAMNKDTVYCNHCWDEINGRDKMATHSKNTLEPLEFERITTAKPVQLEQRPTQKAVWEPCGPGLTRTPTPTGWLVESWADGNCNKLNLVFIPDPDHIWLK